MLPGVPWPPPAGNRTHEGYSGSSRAYPAAVAFPVVNPCADAFLHILRVSMNLDCGRTFEGFEGTDDGGQFHPVIGRLRFATPEFLGIASCLQEYAPATRARVATTAAVSVDGDDVFIVHVVRFPFG